MSILNGPFPSTSAARTCRVTPLAQLQPKAPGPIGACALGARLLSPCFRSWNIFCDAGPTLQVQGAIYKWEDSSLIAQVVSS